MKFLLVLQITVFLLDLILCSPIDFLTPQTRGRKSREIKCPSHLIRDEQGPQVFLTVSSLASIGDNDVVQERMLELNWYNEVPRKQDTVALYDHDPRDNPNDPLAFIKPIGNPESYYVTNVSFPYVSLTLSKTTPINRCLGFWIAYFRGKDLLSTNCLKYNPHWMSDLHNHIGDLQLLDLLLPGTHDAGAYSKFRPGISNLLPAKYTFTHDEDIFNQLMYGVRYLDMRIAYYEATKEKFWVNHGMVRIRPLEDVMEQILNFINSTEEVIIFDIHELAHGFPNNKPERRKLLVNYLEEKLKYRLASREYGSQVTYNDLRRHGKRVIVTGLSDMMAISYYIWERVTHKWADVDKPDELYKYLNQIMSPQATYSYFWSAMAELTPTEMGLAIDKYGGLRKMANNVNRQVTTFLREDWWSKANIVSVDYLLGSNVIDIAINANIKKALCFSRLWTVDNHHKSSAHSRSRVSTFPIYFGPRSILT